jgi:hypothetical protein
MGVFDSKQSQILKKMIITLVFKKNANFFAENWEKSQKIVIITSTPVCKKYMCSCCGRHFNRFVNCC